MTKAPISLQDLRMPLDDGLGPDDQQGIAPALEQPAHENPEHAVAVVDLGALDAAFQHGDLLAKGDVLESESRSIGDQCVDEPEK